MNIKKGLKSVDISRTLTIAACSGFCIGIAFKSFFLGLGVFFGLFALLSMLVDVITYGAVIISKNK